MIGPPLKPITDISVPAIKQLILTVAHVLKIYTGDMKTCTDNVETEKIVLVPSAEAETLITGITPRLPSTHKSSEFPTVPTVAIVTALLCSLRPQAVRRTRKRSGRQLGTVVVLADDRRYTYYCSC